jgi:hypothetical protein
MKGKKKATKKQLSARTKFKAMIAKAKKIYKDNPNKKWTSCVREASKK